MAVELAVSTQRKPKAVYEEFVVASWDVIPRAELCMRAGISLPREESFYTAPFFFSLAQRVRVQAANPEPAALPRLRRNIPPADAGWGCWPRTGAFLGPPRVCRHRETKKPCGLSCSQRSRSAPGLPDSFTPGLLAHTALSGTLLKKCWEPPRTVDVFFGER